MSSDTFAVPVTHHVTSEFLHDVMTTMVETHYEWFRLNDVKRNPPKGKFGVDDDGLAVTSFTAHEIDEETGKSIGHTHIGEQQVIEAMAKIMEGAPVHSGNRASITSAIADNDAGGIDSDLADCILQVACFGEIRYG